MSPLHFLLWLLKNHFLHLSDPFLILFLFAEGHNFVELGCQLLDLGLAMRHLRLRGLGELSSGLPQATDKIQDLVCGGHLICGGQVILLESGGSVAVDEVRD